MFSQLLKVSAFNQLKRFVIVAIVLSNAVTLKAGFLTPDGFAHIVATAVAKPTGSGKVYVGLDRNGTTVPNTCIFEQRDPQEGTKKWYTKPKFTFYFKAEANAGYDFSEWQDENQQTKSNNKVYNETRQGESSDLNKTVSIYRYAIFKPIISIEDAEEYVASEDIPIVANAGETTKKTRTIYLYNATDWSVTETKDKNSKVTFKLSKEPNTSGSDQVVLTIEVAQFANDGETASITFKSSNNEAKATINVVVTMPPTITFDPSETAGTVFTATQENTTGAVYTLTSGGKSKSLEILNENDKRFKLSTTTIPNTHRFYRWVITNGENKSYLYQQTDQLYEAKHLDHITAEFIPIDYATFMVKDNNGSEILFNHLQAACDEAAKKSNKVVYVKQSGKVMPENYTIPAGVTLLVPGDDANSVLTQNDNGAGSGIYVTGDYATSFPSHVCKKFLTLDKNTHITVNGAICVYAKLAGEMGYNGTPLDRGLITMNDGCEIRLKAGSKLFAYGYITNAAGANAQVVAETGANVYEALQIRDWRGGSATTSIVGMNGQGDGTKVFPFGQYYIQNIESKLVVNHGASVHVSTAVNMTGAGLLPLNVPLFIPYVQGTSGMLCMKEGAQLIKWYDSTNDQLHFELKGENVMDQIVMPLKIKIGIEMNLVINSSNYVLPFNSNMSFHLTDADLEVKNDILFFPGSTIEIDNSSSITINKNLYLYDLEQYLLTDKSFFYQAPVNCNVLPLHWTSTGVAPTRSCPTADAKMLVDGQVIVDGKFYTTSGGANITSTGGGKVIYNGIGKPQTTNQKWQVPSETSVSNIDIPVTNAKLHNDKLKYPGNEYVEVSGTGTYTYDAQQGRWASDSEAGISETIIPTFEMKKHATSANVLDGEIVVAFYKPDNVTFSTSNFNVTKTSGDNFALKKYELKADGKLYISITYTQQNKHDDYEAVFTLTDNHDKLELNTPICVTAIENYQPAFSVVEELTVSSTVNVPEDAALTITPETDNITEQLSNEFISWGFDLLNIDESEYTGGEFAFSYGSGDAKLSNAQVTFTPNSTADKTAILRIWATYDEDKDPETSNLVAYKDVTLYGTASLNENSLAFDETWNTMFVGDTQNLFADMGNHANSSTTVIYDENYVTIDIEKNKITASKAGTITIQALQDTTGSHKEANITKEITIYPAEQWNWDNLYYGSKHTNPITTNAASWSLALADDNTSEVKNLVSLTNEEGEYVVTIGEPTDVSKTLTAKFTFTSGSHSNTYTATLSGLRHLDACVETQERYDALIYGLGHTYQTNFVQNVTFDDSNNRLSFTSHTDRTSIWTMQFIGTPDKISFTPSGSLKWHLEESVDATTWSNVEDVAARAFVSGEPVSLSLKPTTRFVRITYNAGEESVGTLTDLCVSKLAISVNINKLYLPIKNDESKTIKLTHTKNVKPSINISPAEGLAYELTTPIYRDGVYETTLTLTATTPQTYTLTATEDGTNVHVEVIAYTFPQGLPIKSNEWIDENKELYHFYTVESSLVSWDATNNRIVFQSPGDDNVPRSLTMAFEGAPSIVSFTFSADINSTQWLIQESIDGLKWDAAAGNPVVSGNTMKQELVYTTRYLRLTYNGGKEWTERYMTDLVIEGYPKVILTPTKLELNETDQTKTFTITAINLQNITLQVDNDNFTLQHGSSPAAKQITLSSEDYPNALGINKVGDISIQVNWVGSSIVNAGEVTVVNPDAANALLGTVELLGAKSAITLDDADKTGIWTGVPDGEREGRPTSAKYTLNGEHFAEYTYRPIDVTNAFLQDASKGALFDYLFIYGETTTRDGSTTITTPTTDHGSNAQTPYYIYKKGTDGVSYEFVEAVENANSANKTQLNFVDAATTTDDEGHTYYSIKPADGKTELSIYITGFCPYATTGCTKYDEGVWYIQGEAGEHVHLYLEDCHIYSRNKTEDGNAFVGRQGSAFTEGYVRGSGGVFVVECLTRTENIAEADSFNVTIHTRGHNVLKSNYGSFFNLMGDLRAFQVSSPIQVHLASDAYVNNSKVTLNFDDIWQVANTGREIDYIRTNGFLSLQKQVNNAPSIDLGNEHTTVNFYGGRVELQNAAIVSTNYKTTLAISHRSGEMGAVGLNILLAYGMGTDAAGGTVNFYDGTTSVIPMTVPEEYRGYYLMDTDAEGKELATTSCLRCPKQTYVYGGSHGMLRACRSVTSRGGAPTDGPGGKPLGKYEYTLITPDEGVKDEVNSNNGLAIIRNFPNDALKTYYSTAPGYLNKTYGLQSVSPIENKLYFWIPEGYNYDVKPEKDATLTTWRTCMTEISASYAGKSASIGGDLEIESDEVVKYLLYCQIDENIHDVITQKDKRTVVEWNDKNDNGEIDEGEESEVEKDVYTYEATVKDPTGQLGGEYFSIRPTGVGGELQNSVTNEDSYQVTDRVYYITTAKADTWMNFTAPFDVENIYVMETFNEALIRHYFDTVTVPNDSEETKYTLTAKYQAKHNADFAAFFAMAMALGSDKPFEDIYDQYIDWAMSQDGFTDSREDYVTRGKTALVHYDGSNFPDAHFYLYRNDESEDWETTDTEVFKTQWQIAPAKSGEIMLEKGTTYSMLFPYSLGVEMEERTFWDYWTGKFLIFESTLGNQSDSHEIYGREEAASLAEDVALNRARLSGNKSFAQFNTERKDVYLYSDEGRLMENYSPNEEEDIFNELTGTTVKVFPTIEPTTTFLIANIESDSPNPAPIRRILRTGEIIYDTAGNGTTTGGNMPTVGGGNDLFVTSIAGGINIAVAAPQYVRVLSSTGALLFSGMVQTSVDVTLPANGVYVIAGENEVQKILYQDASLMDGFAY